MSATEIVQTPPANDDGAEPGVLSADGQPWISYSEPKGVDAESPAKATAKTHILPFALGGAVGVAALAAGAYFLVRKRAQPRGFKHRVARLLGSPIVKTVATSLGGAALAGGTAVLKDVLSKYVSSRAEIGSTD